MLNLTTVAGTLVIPEPTRSTRPKLENGKICWRLQRDTWAVVPKLCNIRHRVSLASKCSFVA